MEMVLALLAVVLFTSIVMLYNNTLWDQNALLINAQQYVQASHLSHSVLDEIDAKLFSKQISFADVRSYNNTQRVINLQHSLGRYTIDINAVGTDSLGTPLASVPIGNIYTRVTVRTSTMGLKVPVSMSRMFTKTHLNL
jgi:hypothetical protein